ncbi:MAG: endo-1,4-beta-xylanase [Alphaproteobacteria bacterium]|nr:endo-1,4-beta-xylanase [Alphaproteobacteria bacterium]
MGLALGALGACPLEAATPLHHRKQRYLRRRTLWRHGPAPAGTAPDSLNGLARARGLRFGSCICTVPFVEHGHHMLASYSDPRYRALFVSQCGLLVPENELKWRALRPSPATFDFRKADMLVDFATSHQMSVRGHTLLWNRPQWFPDWVGKYNFGSNPWAGAEQLLREHISTVCGHYGERIFSYDVVNEAIVPETGELTETVFTKYLGPDAIDLAFQTARAAAPHAQLVYNDFMSWSPTGDKHRAGVLKLLERLKKNNVPIDALGIQSHLGASADGGSSPRFTDIQQNEWSKFLDEVTAMGLDLVITEFDVNDRDVAGDVAARDRAIASLARDYFDLMLGYLRLRYVMCWGLADKYSWLQRSPPRPDGKAKRPCPYDDQFNAKLLEEVLAVSLATAPVRPDMNIQPA